MLSYLQKNDSEAVLRLLHGRRIRAPFAPLLIVITAPIGPPAAPAPQHGAAQDRDQAPHANHLNL
jgi:hypothetical protein